MHLFSSFVCEDNADNVKNTIPIPRIPIAYAMSVVQTCQVDETPVKDGAVQMGLLKYEYARKPLGNRGTAPRPCRGTHGASEVRSLP